MNTESIQKIPALVKKMYRVVKELEILFPGRKFTLDGHLIGSIGEVLAASFYDLVLLPGSTETHDAQSSDGRLIQIKATQAKSIGIRSKPDYLIVLQLKPDGSTQEVFNGPGRLAWEIAGKIQSNGQRFISTARLLDLANEVPQDQRIGKKQPNKAL